MRVDPGYRDEYDPQAFERGPSRRLRTIAWAVAIAALAAFGIVIWYAYNLGIKDGTESVAPLIRADARPTKIKPDQPGGMAVPHQDKEVYETIGSGTATEPKVERLLPPPEQPKSLPTPAPAPSPAPAAQAPAGGSDVAAPPPSDELRALMEREGLAPKNDGQAAEDRPAPPKDEVTTAPPPPATLDPQITAKPPAEPAPAAKPVPAANATGSTDLSGRWRIQLAAFRDRPTAESEWRRLQKKFPDLLGALALEVQEADLGAKGTFYRMRGGPIADEASAKLLCAQLEQQKQGCMVVRP
jgi:hypothetical protein